jgi:hypothetical protein
LTSFFHALSLSRSMSNSLETTFTTIALCYYPWDTTVGPVRYVREHSSALYRDIMVCTDQSFGSF